MKKAKQKERRWKRSGKTQGDEDGYESWIDEGGSWSKRSLIIKYDMRLKFS